MTAVLVVDDDPDVRSLIAFALSDEGFDVSEAGDGDAAVAALEASPPDCMVLDVMMPNLDGFGVLRTMRDRQLARGTRVLMLTCKGEDRDYVRGFDLGAHDYLTKPFDPDTLRTRLGALLAETSDDLEFKRRQELQRAMLLERLQTTFARSVARQGHAVPAATTREPEPEPEAVGGTALPLRWRLGG